MLLLGLTHPGNSLASMTDESLNLPELVARADVIVLGQVRAMHAARSSSRGEISSRVFLEVHTTLKGAPSFGGTLELQVPGGQLEEERELVRGAPRFAPQEQVLVFIARKGSGHLEVLGMAQGKYSLYQDAFSGEAFAVRDLTGLELLVSDPDPRNQRAHELSTEQYALEPLLTRIRSLVGEPVAAR